MDTMFVYLHTGKQGLGRRWRDLSIIEESIIGLDELFYRARERSDTFTCSICVRVLEVYDEQIRDLRATSPATKKPEIRLASEGVHHVPGIVEAKVENIKEVWDVLQAGSNARAVGSNNVNEHSSRSHCVQHAFYNGKI